MAGYLLLPNESHVPDLMQPACLRHRFKPFHHEDEAIPPPFLSSLCLTFHPGGRFTLPLGVEEREKTEREKTAKEELMEQTILRVPSMHCGGCANRIEEAVRHLEGVRRVKADFMAHTVEVAFEPTQLDEAALRSVIEKTGYEVK